MKKLKSNLKILAKWHQSVDSRNANGTPILKLIYNQLKEDMDKSYMPSGLKSMYLMMLGMKDPKTNKTALELYFDNWMACMRAEKVSVEQRESVKRMRELFKAIEKTFFVYDSRMGRAKELVKEMNMKNMFSSTPEAENPFKGLGLTFGYTDEEGYS
jgi:hypothetical protein